MTPHYFQRGRGNSPDPRCAVCAVRRSQHPTPAPVAQDWKFLKVKEVCDRLKIGRSTLYKLIDSGKITPVYLGPRSPRFLETDLERLVA